MTQRTPEGYLQETWDDFSGGLCTADATTLGLKQLHTAENTDLTVTGKVIARPGISKRFATNFSATPVLGFGAFYHSNGTSKLVMASGTTLFVDSPHVNFNYDTQADFNTGVHDADTTTSSGDVKLPAKPTATFARASVAYKRDFTQVLSGAARYETFYR